MDGFVKISIISKACNIRIVQEVKTNGLLYTSIGSVPNYQKYIRPSNALLLHHLHIHFNEWTHMESVKIE